MGSLEKYLLICHFLTSFCNSIKVSNLLILCDGANFNPLFSAIFTALVYSTPLKLKILWSVNTYFSLEYFYLPPLVTLLAILFLHFDFPLKNIPVIPEFQPGLGNHPCCPGVYLPGASNSSSTSTSNSLYASRDVNLLKLIPSIWSNRLFISTRIVYTVVLFIRTLNRTLLFNAFPGIFNWKLIQFPIFPPLWGHCIRTLFLWFFTKPYFFSSMGDNYLDYPQGVIL